MNTRKHYPSDVSDEEWAFVAPYLILLPLDAEQRKHDLREVFNALRWLVRSGAPWRYLPNDFPRWEAVYQQTQRWINAGSFEAIVHDLRALLRLAQGRNAQPSAAIFDARTMQSTPESGARAGYDGHKHKKGSKVHAAVDTLGHLLALHVTPANEQERAQVKELAQAVQEVTGQNVEIAFVDQGYTGEKAAEAAHEQGIHLEVVKLPEAKKGFVLLPRRWVVETTHAHYPPNAFVDNRAVVSDHRDHRAAQPRGGRRDETRRQASVPKGGILSCSPPQASLFPPARCERAAEPLAADSIRQSSASALAAEPPRRTPTDDAHSAPGGRQ